MNLFAELKRRKVFRVAVVYAATAFAVLQAADIMLPRVGVPDWVMNLFVVLTILGFPIALLLAWALEVTPDGSIQRTETTETAPTETPALLGARTVVVAGLLVAVGIGLSAGWMLKPDRQAAPSESAQAVPTTSERQSIAVLPFDSLSDDPEQGYFADGLTEEILNALAGIPNLLVTARTSSFFYKDKDAPVDEIAGRLGVAHILEGSVRRAGDRMRVTAQLIRAADGFHLWSQTYDRSVDDAFAIQTDVATEVATALGILLDDAQRARMEASGVRDPEAYALYAKGVELYQLAHGGAPQIPTLVRANVYFDRAFAKAPGLWAARYHSADLYTHILLDLAGGIDPATLPANEVARVREQHEQHLRAASRAAPNAAARDFVEITRRLASEDWTGLAALAHRAFQHNEACGFDQWMHVIGPAYGMAEVAREFFVRSTQCNALDEANWLHAAATSIYAGDATQALEIAERGLAVANVTGFGLEEIRFASLIALDRHDEARASLSRLGGSTNFNRTKGEAWLSAARGESGALERARQQFADPANETGIATVLYLTARAGDRRAANTLAAEIDAREGGPMFLMVGTYFCLCGAPFDLEATPNLAARLDEAGLAWPPVESMRWPLKDW
jgi:TolB-like protein